ncbi:MAG TPA: glycosyl hydrolase, partial [Firmicutes bacterium]|nr:glycosyl hydrolase [Bacillota bacterium]
ARHADYLAVMTYDEHYAGSPRAGSVASLPWVEKGIQGLLGEVPAQRLLLGIPFYTRLWKEEKSPEGRIKVSSRALGMADAEAAVAAAGAVPVYDAKSGQDYAEWTQEGATYRIWLENERSLQSRVQLVHRYGLAGVACWRRGFEREDIWPFMAAHLRR